MRVRWTTDAADDLERICDYIAENRPDSAQRVAQSLVERIGTLETFPRLGRPGRVHGTREMPSRRSRSSESMKFATNRSSYCEFCTERSDGRRRKPVKATQPRTATSG
jgi:plasmid stabilization system protein ParE